MSPERKSFAIQTFTELKESERLTKLSAYLIQSITQYQYIDIRRNEPSFFKIELKNPYEYNEFYNLTLEDEDSKFSHEVSLIKSIDELEMWYQQGHYEYKDFKLIKEQK